MVCNADLIQTLATDDSCPCRPANQCPNRSEFRYNNSQVLILPCESESLARCCSIVPKPIESAYTNGPFQDHRNRLEANDETDTETDANEILSVSDSMYVGENLEVRSSVPSLEISSSDAPVLSLNVRFSEDHRANTDTVEEKSVDRTVPSGSHANASRTVKNLVNFTNANKESSLQLLKPRQRYVGTVKKIETSTPTPVKQEESITRVSDRFVTSDVPRFTQNNEEESYIKVLIDQATNFESYRTSSRQAVLFQNRDSKAQKRTSLAGRIDPPIRGEAILNKAYRPKAIFELPSIPKSVTEKINGHLEQKTSLEIPLTLDEVSTRATNENASSVSKLDSLQRDDTLIRNLSHPEDTENVKRVSRSGGSVFNEESKVETTEGSFNSSNSSSVSNVNAETVDQDQTKATQARRFKRPPRILPTKNLRSEENASNKFTNSRQRGRSLFDILSERRKKHASIIINRSNSSLKKFAPVNDNSTSAEERENVNGSSDNNVNLLSIEEDTRSIDR